MEELEYPFDPNLLLKKRRAIKKKLLSDGSQRLHKKIAILGGSTTEFVKQSLELFLLNFGIEPEFYESDFGRYYQDAVFGNEQLDAFAPDFVYVCTSNRNLEHYPELSMGKEQAEQLLESEAGRYAQVWDALGKRFHVPILQNNFEKPYFRLLGNREAADFRGRVHFINQLNVHFADAAAARSDLYLVDLDYISSDYGLKQWSDPFYWYMYKCAAAIPAVPYLAFNVACIIKALLGKNKKGLVLDLDNTLWGGVIGDDGPEGIRIGHEDSEGQAFFEFQQYLKLLKQTGLVLAVDSKNDETNAIEGLKHPEGVLRPNDFAEIKANWETKGKNFSSIASDLNVLPESLVFVDDNPAERHQIKLDLPEVSAPAVEDVAHYIGVIDRSGFFENVQLSTDDLQRAQMYRQNAERKQAQSRFSDYGEYLDSLEMKADIRAFEPLYYQRLSQLANKSNQFNLTTKRYTPEEIQAVAEDSQCITLYARLIDRFGDNGVVSEIIGRIDGDVLRIDLWLMSCRVLKRDLEKAMADELLEQAQLRGLSAIIGTYLPTPKNHMVSDLLGELGYTRISKPSGGECVWMLKLLDSYGKKINYAKLNCHIAVNAVAHGDGQ